MPFLTNGAQPPPSYDRDPQDLLNLNSQDSPGFLDYLSDIPTGAARGVVGFGESLVELADSGFELFGGDLVAERDTTFTEELLGQNKTWVGGLTQGITQFSLGFVPIAGVLGKVSKLNSLRRAGLGGRIAFDTLAGVPADFVAFGGHEERLSDLVQQYPVLQNPITDFLSSDEDDSELEGRFKNAIEGAVMGPVADVLLSSLRFFRGAKKAGEAGGPKAREDFIRKNAEKYTEELEQIENPLSLQEANVHLQEAGFGDEEIQAWNATVSAVSKTFGVDEDTLVGVTLKDIRQGDSLVEAPADALEQAAGETVKGRVSFTDDSRAVIELFDQADISTIMHESSHVFRRNLQRFSEDLSDKSDKLFGVEPGSAWSREDEKNFATSFESYLKEGKAPNHGMKEVFGKFKTWLTDIYSKLAPTRAGDKISPEVRDFFDELMGGRTAVQRNLDIPVKVRDRIADRIQMVSRGEVELDDALQGIDLNFDKILADADAKEVMNIVSEELSTQIGKLKGGVEKLSETREKALKALSDDLDAPEGLMDRLRERKADAKDIYAAKITNSALAQRIVALGTKMNVGSATKRDMASFLRHVEEQAHLQADLKANITNAARITSAGRLPVESSLTSDKLDELIIRAGGSKRLQEVAKHIKMGEGDPRVVSRIIKERWDTKGRKVINVHNEVWLNSILSGPVTHAVNLISTLTHGVTRSVEKTIGGALALNPSLAREGMDEIAGLFFTLKDSVKFSAKALKAGDSILDVGNQTLDAPQGAIRGDGSKSPKSLGLDYLGTFIRLPGRFLTAEDELNKQLFYRSNLFAKGLQEAKKAGLPAGPKRVQFAMQHIETKIDAGGRALDEAALYHAQEGTFTNDLAYGVGQSLQKFVNRHPSTRLILPFVRTPTNIFRQMWRHTPGLAVWQKQWAADFHSGDPARRALAVGQQVVGSTLIGGAAMAAMSGRITGGGPSDPRERALLRQTGWQPYSLVTTDETGNKKYTSYQRLDPFASAIGLVADYVEIGNRVDENDQQELAIGLMAAFAKNVTNKTYLRGLAEAVDVLTDPEQNAERWMQRQVGSYVPNFLNQTNPDDTLREVRGYMDALKAKTPGYSETLDPRRNVFGQPITFEGALGPDFVSPFYQSRGLKGAARQELVDLELALGQPREEVQPGLDLTQIRVSNNQTAYDRWLEKVGEVKINNKGLEDYLNDLVTSDAFKNLPAQSTLPSGIDSARSKYVKRAITRYRNKALMEVLKERPDIAELYKNAAVNARRISVLGAAAGVE